MWPIMNLMRLVEKYTGSTWAACFLENKETDCGLNVCSCWFQNQIQPPMATAILKLQNQITNIKLDLDIQKTI